MTRSSLPLSRTFLGGLVFLLFLSPALGLQPNHEADRLILAAEEALADNNYSQAEEHLNAARRLGVGLPTEYHFFQGKLLQHQDELNRARTRLEQYVNNAGNGGRHYQEALSLITQIEKERSGIQPADSGDDEGTSEIRWSDNHQEYVEHISELYQQADASQALTQHINSLLKFYAYGDDRVIASSRLDRPSRHEIHTSDSGEIVSQSKFGVDHTGTHREDRFTVYGVDPYLDYQCSRNSANCWVMHPVTSERWLQIVRNEEVAEELTRAFSQLIKRMQKRG